MNAIVLEREVCAQNYAPMPIMLSHGEGSGSPMSPASGAST